MKFLTAFTLTFFMTVVARGDLVIDNFEVGSVTPAIFETTGQYSVVTTTGDVADILGGVRKWQVEVIQHSVTETRIYESIGGVFGVTNGFAQNADVSIIWDGSVTNSNLGFVAASQDLTQSGVNDHFSLDVVFADLTTQFQIVATDSVGSSSVSKLFLGPGTTDYLFSDFTGIDFTDIQSLQLNISGPDAYDVAISSFSAVPISAVPEPSSMMLLGVFLLGGCGVRRSRRSVV